MSTNLVLQQDPLTMALEAFSALYPDSLVRVGWVEDQDCPGSCYYWPGQPPFVGLRTDLPIGKAITVLIHELAHAVTGHETDHHGTEWEQANTRILAEYEQRVAVYQRLLSRLNPGLARYKKGTHEQNDSPPAQVGGEIQHQHCGRDNCHSIQPGPSQL
jgi:hypothetical protein